MKKERKRREEIRSGGQSALIGMIRELPGTPAPPALEGMVYRSLGIIYIPLYRKVLIMGGLSIFAGWVYFAARWIFSSMAERLSLAGVTQCFAKLYSNVMEAIGIIRVGYHLKEILISFTNPWFFVVLAVVSSALMLILIAIVKSGKGQKVLVNSH